MKFSIPFLMCLVTELVSVDARFLTSSLGRRDEYDVSEDLVLHLMARDDLDYDEMSHLFTRGRTGKNRAQQQKNGVQQQNNQGQQNNNKGQQRGNEVQQFKNSQQQINNNMQQGGNKAQKKDNAGQQRANAGQQNANAKQKQDNSAQGQHNADQLAHNQQQADGNLQQAAKNEKQKNRNKLQKVENKSQYDNNEKQKVHNDEQKDANTRQQTDNEATRKAIDKSKPSTLDKCLDFASGACTVAGGITSLVGAKKMHDNPDDPSGYALAVAGGAATIAAGGLTLAKEPLKKCVGAACYLAKKGYDWYQGKNQPQAPAHAPALSQIVVTRALERRSALRNVLGRRGVPAPEIAKQVNMDTHRYISRSLVERSMAMDMLDEMIWG